MGRCGGKPLSLCELTGDKVSLPVGQPISIILPISVHLSFLPSRAGSYESNCKKKYLERIVTSLNTLARGRRVKLLVVVIDLLRRYALQMGTEIDSKAAFHTVEKSSFAWYTEVIKKCLMQLTVSSVEFKWWSDFLEDKQFSESRSKIFQMQAEDSQFSFNFSVVTKKWVQSYQDKKNQVVPQDFIEQAGENRGLISSREYFLEKFAVMRLLKNTQYSYVVYPREGASMEEELFCVKQLVGSRLELLQFLAVPLMKKRGVPEVNHEWSEALDSASLSGMDGGLDREDKKEPDGQANKKLLFLQRTKSLFFAPYRGLAHEQWSVFKPSFTLSNTVKIQQFLTEPLSHSRRDLMRLRRLEPEGRSEETEPHDLHVAILTRNLVRRIESVQEALCQKEKEREKIHRQMGDGISMRMRQTGTEAQVTLTTSQGSITCHYRAIKGGLK